jgi:hypothetical protein
MHGGCRSSVVLGLTSSSGQSVGPSAPRARLSVRAVAQAEGSQDYMLRLPFADSPGVASDADAGPGDTRLGPGGRVHGLARAELQLPEAVVRLLEPLILLVGLLLRDGVSERQVAQPRLPAASPTATAATATAAAAAAAATATATISSSGPARESPDTETQLQRGRASAGHRRPRRRQVQVLLECGCLGGGGESRQ